MAVASALAFSSSGPFVKPLLEAGWSLGAALLVRMGVAGLDPVARARSSRCAAQRVVPPPPLAAHPRVRAHPPCSAASSSSSRRCSGCRSPSRCSSSTSRRCCSSSSSGCARAGRRRALVLVGFGRRDRRSRARRRHLGCVVRSARHAARPRAPRCASCAYFVISERAGDDLPPLALAAGGLLVGAALMAILCVSGILPFRRPPSTVVLAGVRGAVVRAAAVGRRRSRRRSATRSASWPCRASARASRRSSGCRRCCSRSGSRGSSSARCRRRSSSSAAR